jgi:hypothetical protein
MIPSRTLLQLLASLAIVLLGTIAAAAPKAGSRVREQDVTLDEDSGDSDDAPKKKRQQTDADDDDDDEDSDESDEKPARAADEDQETRKPAAAPVHGGCQSDLECDGKAVCKEGKCVDPNAEVADEAEGALGPAVWLSLGLVADAMFISGTDVCTEKSQVSGGFTCTRASGSQYHGTPLPGGGGKVSGISFGPLRLAISASARLAQNISAGVRLGYAVLGQGPRPDGGHNFLAFSAEVQGAYWFSDHAFSTKSVGPFIELSGGLAEIDGHSKVTVHEDTTAPKTVSQLDNPPQQSLDAYQKAGAGFAGAGAGVFIPFGQRAGLLADLRVLQLFPSSGTALSLGVSGAFGL